jgi:galactokinase
VEATSAREFAGAAGHAYRQRTGLDPAVYVCHPSAGASLRRL